MDHLREKAELLSLLQLRNSIIYFSALPFIRVLDCRLK